MNTLKYKDFIGSVAFSETDGVFFGKIEGIDGLVNFEGESVAELTNAFHEAVDDYLAYCAEEGIEPHKSYSGSLNVRLTPDIHTRVAYLAKQAGVSINSFIRTAVEKQIAAMLRRYDFLTPLMLGNLQKALTLHYPNEIKGKNIEIVTSVIREQRIGWHYNIMNTA